MKAPRPLVAGGHLGIWAAAADVFPEIARAEVLESQAHQRPGPDGTSASPLKEISNSYAIRFVERYGPAYPAAARDPATGLGAGGDLLRLPEGALEAP